MCRPRTSSSSGALRQTSRKLRPRRIVTPEHARRRLDSRVMQGRDERRALNEAYFRDFNERVVEQVKDIAGEQAPFNIVCECSHLTCAERIILAPAEYELLHEDRGSSSSPLTMSMTRSRTP